MEPTFKELHRVLGPGGSLCLQVGNHVHRGEIFPLDAFYFRFLRSLSFLLRERIIWHFEHGLHAKNRFSGRYESVLWFTKSDNYTFNLDNFHIPSSFQGPRYYHKTSGRPAGMPPVKNPGDYWSVEELVRQDWESLMWNIPNVKANHPEKTSHPCQFPVELVQRCVLVLSNEGDTVLDPFAGTGSTAIAAISLNRKAVLCEQEPEYIETARRRIEDYRGGTLKTRPLCKPIHQPSGREQQARMPEEWQTGNHDSQIQEEKTIGTVLQEAAQT